MWISWSEWKEFCKYLQEQPRAKNRATCGSRGCQTGRLPSWCTHITPKLTPRPRHHPPPGPTGVLLWVVPVDTCLRPPVRVGDGGRSDTVQGAGGAGCAAARDQRWGGVCDLGKPHGLFHFYFFPLS